MPILNDEPSDAVTLSDPERDWLRRQGRAARGLEARQRQSARRAAWRNRAPAAAAAAERQRSAGPAPEPRKQPALRRPSAR